MKIGFSSYSFHQRLGSGQMDVFDVIDWVADNGGEHLEFAAIYPVDDSPLPTPATAHPRATETARGSGCRRCSRGPASAAGGSART